jgi:NitT/TauT family transport system permease protein
MALSVLAFFAVWWVLVNFEVWRFSKIPDPLASFGFFTTYSAAEHYPTHITSSLFRIAASFSLATILGVPLGLMMGWNKTVNNFLFPIVELLRPIPPVSWVPIAVLVFAQQELSITFVPFLASFFATILNTILGVESIETNYFRAAKCLGASSRDVLKHVVIPGAMPAIFTGLTIGMGLSWFSLVGAEMIAGEFGLGYMVYEGYTMVIYSQIVIAMFTIGFLGYASSALIRRVGTHLMAWRGAEW